MINLASYFTFETLAGLVWIGIMLGAYEYAHYLIAKKQSIFKRWVFFGIGMGVEMTTYLKSRWDYLWGIVASFVAFPLFLWLKPADTEWWWFFVFAVLIGIVDVIVFIFYTPITKAIDKEEAQKYQEQNGGITYHLYKGGTK
jgi:hypothetical protein